MLGEDQPLSERGEDKARAPGAGVVHSHALRAALGRSMAGICAEGWAYLSSSNQSTLAAADVATAQRLNPARSIE